MESYLSEQTTRLLEQREQILRSSVQNCEVLQTEKNSLLLKSYSTVSMWRKITSGSSEMFSQQDRARVGQSVEGRIRIDVVSDRVLRVRYAQGSDIPENATRMVVGTPAAPSRCNIDISTSGFVTIMTPAMRATVSLEPFRLDVVDSDGNKVCGAGGPEKDNFVAWDSYNTGFCRRRDRDRWNAVENFDLCHDEAIYGLGEKFLALNKVGQTVDLNTTDAMGVTTPRAYKNVPFYISTNGYGVFFDHSSIMTLWVGSMSAIDVQVAIDDDFMDYYLFVGDMKTVLSLYTDITGKGALPPKWTFGYWQSKISYKSAEETLDIARKLREHEVPCDVIHLDTHWFETDWLCDLEFDKERFPDPEAYIRELAGMGYKLSLWQLPYIPSGTKLFDDLAAVDGFVKTADGKRYDVRVCFAKEFKGIEGVVDYTNPEAVRVHQAAFRRLFKMGAKVVKTDFGEFAPADGVYHDGTPGHQMHNLYPLIYNKAIFEVTQEETGDGVVWARSAWAGSQRYPIHWGGDNTPNYLNMVPQLCGGLSFGLSGFQFWSQDIGGFMANTNDRLLTRWMQIGMFCSHSRIHGKGDRELYKFSPETLRICREYIRLRYRLMPYIYGQALKCVEQSLPMLRPLVIEYPSDRNVRSMVDEWLFGDSLLVAPVVTEGTERDVYLPEGAWTDWWTGERIAGNRWIHVQAPLETLPLYVREGAIIPMGPVMNYVDEKPTDRLDIKIAPFTGNGRSELTIAVGNNWVPATYTAANGKHTLVAGKTAADIHIEPLGKTDISLERGG